MAAVNFKRDEFLLESNVIYLNHAAVAPWPRRTMEAVQAFARENAHQGAKAYPQWLLKEAELRRQLAGLINAPSEKDIALLKNTSEALSIVAFGLEWKAGDNIVSSNEEFPSNRIVWQALEQKGVELRQAGLGSSESPEQALFEQVNEDTRLIAVSSIEYASGLRLDLVQIGDFCRRHGILFCVDAIQSIGAVEFDVQAIGADFVMADGHKWMLGPEGLALFYCRPGLRQQLQLNQYGWHMIEDYLNYEQPGWEPASSARRFECGSPNMTGIHALSASLSVLQDYGMAKVERDLLANTQQLIALIETQPELELLSDPTPGRYGGIIAFRHKQKDSHALYKALTRQDVICARRGGGIRFSPHFYTPMKAIETAVRLAATIETGD